MTAAIGQPYRPEGPIDVRSIITTVILGAVVASVGAGLIWLWERSPIPTLLLFTSMIQGAIVGIAMAFMVGKMHLRTPKVVALVGFLCGLLSIGLVHYGHHLHLVHAIAEEIKTEAEKASAVPNGPDEAKEVLKRLETNPNEVVDQALVQETGHGGFLGTMMLRNQKIGETIKKMKITGVFLWILWGVEALIVAGMASLIAAGRAGQPYCEDCGLWHKEQANVLLLGGGHAQPLATAVRDNDVSSVINLRDNPRVLEVPGQTTVTLHSCENCGQTYADVAHKVEKGKETKVNALVSKINISPEMVAALTTKPEPPVIPESEVVPVE